MIIICGDSWAAGEWNEGVLSHPGLSQILTDHGHTVINLSVPGGSNREAVANLEKFMIVNHHLVNTISTILFFQTEWTRDFDESESLIQFESFSQLEGFWISKFYYELLHAKNKHNINCDILLIGGASDVLEFGEFNNVFAGLKIAIGSLTSCLLNVELPATYSWWHYRTEHIVEYIKQNKPEFIEDLLSAIDLGKQRYDCVKDTKEYFYPDGAHPNRQAHKILYNKLMELNIISHQVASGSSHFKHSASSNLLTKEARDE